MKARLKELFIRHAPSMRWASALLIALSIIYLVSPDWIFFIPHIEFTDIHKFIFLLEEVFLLVSILQIFLEDRWKGASKITYLFIFCASNYFFAQPFLRLYLEDIWLGVPEVRHLQPFMKLADNTLLVITVMLAFLARRDLNVFRKWLLGLIEKKRIKDEQAVAVRNAHIAKRYPKLASVPLLGQFIASFRREEWVVSLSLVVFIGAGLALRMCNLDLPFLHSDETFHLVAAKAIYQGEAFNHVDYHRCLYTVTFPAVLSMRLLGKSLWAARMAGVLFNVLAVIPLYLLTKRINKPIAVLAVGLHMLNPLMISTSQMVREYAYMAFYFYLVAFMMVKLYEAFPDAFVLIRDYRKLLCPKVIFYVCILGFVIYYVVIIDPLSTFKVIIMLYLAFVLVLARKFDWRNRSNLWLGAIFLAAGVLILSNITLFEGDTYNFSIKGVNDFFLPLFYGNPIQQCNYNCPLFSITVLVLALLIIPFLNKHQFSLPFIVTNYLIAQAAFALFQVRGNKVRYAIPIQIWHVAIMAAGLYVAYIILQTLLKNRSIAWIVVLLLFLNIPHITSSHLQDQFGYSPITYAYISNVAPAYEYLETYLNKDDVLITTTFIDRYIQWEGGVKVGRIIHYWYDQPDAEQVIFDAIETYPEGWIVLDYERGYKWSQPFPLGDSEHADKLVMFTGYFADQFIYHWIEKVE